MCRESQLGTPQAFIIGDPKFKGDATALGIKEDCEREEELMHIKLSLRDVSAMFDKINALTADEDTFQSWKKAESKRKLELLIEERKASTQAGLNAANRSSESQSNANGDAMDQNNLVNYFISGKAIRGGL
jgi:hypothetical protein